MAAQGGLMTYGSSVTAGMVTVREEGVGLFDHLSRRRHKRIFSSRDVTCGSTFKAHFCCVKRNCRSRFYSLRLVTVN